MTPTTPDCSIANKLDGFDPGDFPEMFYRCQYGRDLMDRLHGEHHHISANTKAVSE